MESWRLKIAGFWLLVYVIFFFLLFFLSESEFFELPPILILSILGIGRIMVPFVEPWFLKRYTRPIWGKDSDSKLTFLAIQIIYSATVVASLIILLIFVFPFDYLLLLYISLVILHLVTVPIELNYYAKKIGW